MPARALETHVRQERPVAVIDLHGEINSLGDDTLNEAFAVAMRNHPTAVLLNFRDVDYINSTGIALIVGLMAQARKAGVPLLTCGLSDHYQEIFHITRLSDFMSIFPDEASALAQYAARPQPTV